jgi:hypothetical protein
MEENQNGEGKVKPKATPLIPAGDLDFGTVANDAITKWKAEPWLTLQYISQGDAQQKVDLFNEIIGNRKEDGSDRPQVTVALKTVNEEIDGSLKYVKGYLSEEHGEEGKAVVQSYYPAFGILKKGNTFEIPTDASNRAKALDLMLKGIKDNQFENKKYGLAFWTDIKTRYDALVKLSRDLDGGISDYVGEKNLLKEELHEILISLSIVLEGNFPKTYREQLRKWGFQKEKY